MGCMIRRAIWFLCGLGTGFLVGHGYFLHDVARAILDDTATLQTGVALDARPLVLTPGDRWRTSLLARELSLLGWQRVSNPTQNRQYHVAENVIRLQVGDQPVQVTFSNDQVRALSGQKTLKLPAVSLGNLRGGTRRPSVPLAEIPALLVMTLQAVEDRNFKHHTGISLTGIARAAWRNIRAGALKEGGSTITQQLVKSQALSPEKRWWRKFNEAYLSVLLEAQFGKAAVLQRYLNTVYLGQQGNREVRGVVDAAQFYFGKSLSELLPQDIALLVGLIRGPSWYNPWRNPDRSIERRNRVLYAMYDTGLIALTDYKSLQAKPLGIVEQPKLIRASAEPYADMILDYLAAALPRNAAEHAQTVVTTLDPVLQDVLQRQASRALTSVEQNRNLKNLQVAAVLLERNTGAVRALVSGRHSGGFNRALAARRPIGSLIKPVIYQLALSQRQDFQLHSFAYDEPLSLPTTDATRWRPENFDGEYLGEISLLTALAQSRNLATVRLGLDLGLDNVAQEFDRYRVPYGPVLHPSAMLGAVEMTPLEVARLYQALADGYMAPLLPVEVVRTDDQEVWRPGHDHAPTRMQDSGTTGLLTRGLMAVFEQGTASRYSSHATHLAGKTGTTNDNRDAWFAGFDSRYVLVVWAGRDDNTSAGVGGASVALPIWMALMTQLPNQSPLVTPGIVPAWINAAGERVAQDCENTTRTWFHEDALPRQARRCKAGEGWF